MIYRSLHEQQASENAAKKKTILEEKKKRLEALEKEKKELTKEIKLAEKENGPKRTRAKKNREST